VENGERELFRTGGGFLPPRTRSRLHPCPSPFIVSAVVLLPHLILEQGDSPRVSTHTPEILHKSAHALKKWKLTQSDENKLEWTHPWADGPFS
jgi:hypothetical protein